PPGAVERRCDGARARRADGLRVPFTWRRGVNLVRVRIPFRRRLSRRSLSRRRVAALGLTTFGITTLMASGCTTSDPAASRSAARATSSVSTSVIADRLEVPWGIAFLPDGSALVTERDRRDILRLTPGTNGGRWNVTKVQTVDEAVAAGEG